MLSQPVYYFTNLLVYLLLIRAVMSWVVRDYTHPFVKVIMQLTDPLLLPMRTLFENMGLNRSGIDFSFLATFLLLQFLSNGIIGVLVRAGL